MLSLRSHWLPRRRASAQLSGFLCARHQHPAPQGRAGRSPGSPQGRRALPLAVLTFPEGSWRPWQSRTSTNKEGTGLLGRRGNRLNYKARSNGSVLDVRESKGWGYCTALGTPNLYSTTFCETTKIEADDLSWGSMTHMQRLITKLVNRYFTGLISYTPATADHPHPSQIL